MEIGIKEGALTCIGPSSHVVGLVPLGFQCELYDAQLLQQDTQCSEDDVIWWVCSGGLHLEIEGIHLHFDVYQARFPHFFCFQDTFVIVLVRRRIFYLHFFCQGIDTENLGGTTGYPLFFLLVRQRVHQFAIDADLWLELVGHRSDWTPLGMIFPHALPGHATELQLLVLLQLHDQDSLVWLISNEAFWTVVDGYYVWKAGIRLQVIARDVHLFLGAHDTERERDICKIVFISLDGHLHLIHAMADQRDQALQPRRDVGEDAMVHAFVHDRGHERFIAIRVVVGAARPSPIIASSPLVDVYHIQHEHWPW